MKNNDAPIVQGEFAGGGGKYPAEAARNSANRYDSPIASESDQKSPLSAAAHAPEGDVRSDITKRWVRIVLLQLPPDGRVSIRLNDKQASSWAMGDSHTDLVGISLETASRNTVLKLNSFLINKSELLFSTYAACEEIRLSICVESSSDVIRGLVDVPLGASATFQSEVDRTSLIGLSSFALSFAK